MVNKLCCFKASITVDINIPDYLEEERSSIFIKIVFDLLNYIHKNYKYTIKICADYTNCNKIDIYRFKDGGNNQILSEVIRNSLNNLTKVEYNNENNESKITTVDYVIEFDYSNKYYLIASADNMIDRINKYRNEYKRYCD